jgi:hypothetical protein
MKVTELAWFAGFFDARGIETETQVRVNAINFDDRLVLDLFKARFGGRIHITSHRKRGQLYWLVTGQKMRDFLCAIQPYRILEEAETARANTFLDNLDS